MLTFLLVLLCLSLSTTFFKEEEEKDDGESKDVSNPTHWAKLDPKSMKVNDLRKELDCRSLSSKGLKSQLIARLTKQLKVEEQVEEFKEPEKPEVKPPEEEEPSRTEDREEEEKKKQEELERQRRERHYILPDEPTILVHPNWSAKNGKFDCSVMSLSVLLDYRLEDNKETSFEVSLFAELFNEMLQRDFGYRIYKAIAAIPVKDEKKKAKKEAEKKEVDKKDIKKEKEDSEEPAAKKSREDEEGERKKCDDKMEKKESREEEENEDDGSTANADEYDPMEAEDADDDDDDEKDDDTSNDKRDHKDARRLSKEKSLKEKDKKQMMTHNRELLMAFVYFDQSHWGCLLEKDLEDILYTLGLHMSRAQIKKLMNKPQVRESCYYRKLTDRGKDEAAFLFNEAQMENSSGNRELLPAPKKSEPSEPNQSGDLIVYNGAMVDVGSMMQKLEKSVKAREEIEQKLMVQDTKMDEETKVKAHLEQENKSLSKELEEVKTRLMQTEKLLKNAEEQKTIYWEQFAKTCKTLTDTITGLTAVMGKDDAGNDCDEATREKTPQVNGAEEPTTS